jgi:indole-3-glycerol phosphate synthase
MKSPIFIAEIKTQSPYGFKSPHSFKDLMDTAIAYGDWVSVHTSALWGGDYETLAFVRRNTSKPIVAKGLHSTDDDIRKALEHGADYVLVVDRVPYPRITDVCGWRVWEKTLFELNNTNLFTGNLIHHPEIKDCKFVYNERDLRTGMPKEKDEFHLYENVWVCQASGIRDPDDLREGISAFIVGEHLVPFCQRYRKKTI